MNKVELAPGIVVYKDVLDNHSEIVQLVEQANIDGVITWKPAQVKSSEDVTIDKTTRDTLAIGVEYKEFKKKNIKKSLMGKINAEISQKLHDACTPLEDDYKVSYGFATTKHDNYSILKYGQGQKFTNHIDDHVDYPRRMSTVLYLNHNYSGGEIVFPRFNLTYKPNANEMIVFPSNYMYNHSVLPVTDGVRYAVVSWLV